MTLLIDGHSFHYEMENLCRIYFPYQKIIVTKEPAEDNMLVYTGLAKKDDGYFITARIAFHSYVKQAEDFLGTEDDEREQERRMAVLLFGLLVDYCGFTPKWGILTGVRPVKLLRHLIEEMGQQAALDFFKKKLLVSAEKQT